MRITNFAKRTMAAALTAFMVLTMLPETALAAGGEALRAALAARTTAESAPEAASAPVAPVSAAYVGGNDGNTRNTVKVTYTPKLNVPILCAQTMYNQQYKNEFVNVNGGGPERRTLFHPVRV